MSSSFPRTFSFRAVLAGLCCALIALAAAPSAQAQTPPPSPPADMEALQLEKMTLELDLTDAQRAEVQTIMADQGERRQALMQKYQQRAQSAASDSAAAQALRSEMQGEMQAMQSETEGRLADVLDEGQMERYRTLYAQQPQPDADPVDANIAQLDAQFDLTGEQRTELRPVIAQQMDQMQSLRQEIQAAGQDQQKRQQVMQKAQQMQQETQQQFQAILTDAQMQKMQQLQQVQRQIQQAQQQMRRQRMQQMRQMQQQRQQDGGQ